MSNAVLNAHVMLGYPCGEGATLSEVADWAGDLIMSGNGGLENHQISWLKSIGEYLHTESPEPGQRELALEEYYRLWDSIAGNID